MRAEARVVKRAKRTQRNLIGPPASGRCPNLGGMPTPSEYAADLGRANDKAIAFALSCTPEEWAAVVPGDSWPIGVVIHHIAEGFNLVSGWIDCARAGTPIEVTGEEIDANNLAHAEARAGVGVAETVELLKANGDAAVTKVGQLDESDLGRTAEFGPAGGRPFSVEQFCQAAIGHVSSHLGRAQAAVGRDDENPKP